MSKDFTNFIRDTYTAEFTRCKYKNKEGFYGSKGKCVKGTEVPPKPKGKTRLASPDFHPSYQALLLTIQTLEGTDKSQQPYKVMFGGKEFKGGFKNHPRSVQEGWSDAAGAYQFLSTTWDDFTKATGLKGFTPRNQDKAALWLIESRLTESEMKDLLKFKLTPQMIHKLGREWASMPCEHGKSCYNQPSKSVEEVQKLFKENLRKVVS